MYDGLTDTYNSYGTSTKSSYYSKSQAGSGSWGYPVRDLGRQWGQFGSTGAKAVVWGGEGLRRAPDADQVPLRGQCVIAGS